MYIEIEYIDAREGKKLQISWMEITDNDMDNQFPSHTFEELYNSLNQVLYDKLSSDIISSGLKIRNIRFLK